MRNRILEIAESPARLRVERQQLVVQLHEGQAHTIPLDDLYFELKPGSRNLGEVSYDALVSGAPQSVERNLEGAYQLFRIGDAVAARNTHAAIYDALRLAKDL